MSLSKICKPKFTKIVLVLLLIYGFVFAWVLVFSEFLLLINCDSNIIDNKDKLAVLIIASMTVGATLLTTTPTDDRVKQFAFLLISITAAVAAVVAIRPESWGLLGFLIAGLAPAVAAFGLVFGCLFRESIWAFLLLVLGAVLVWVAAFLLNSDQGLRFRLVSSNSRRSQDPW